MVRASAEQPLNVPHPLRGLQRLCCLHQGKRIITGFERARIYPCHKSGKYAGLQPLREGSRQKKHSSGPKGRTRRGIEQHG
jgi:hypothetical protein